MDQKKRESIEKQLPQIKQHLEEHGWALIKQVFSPEEIAAMRKGALDSLADQDPNRPLESSSMKDMLADKYIGHVVYDDRLLMIVRYLLQTERPLYLGEANCIISKNAYYPQAFHKDSSDREDGNAPDWTKPYDMIRFGVYMQDHTEHSGGLFVRDKSHTRACIDANGRIDAEWGEKIYLRTEVGDLAVWSFKTSHAGAVSVPRFGFMEKLFSPKRLYQISKAMPMLFEPFVTPRVAFFMGFGNDRRVSNRYLDYMKTRVFGIRAGKSQVYSPELLEKVKDKFDILDIHNAVKGIEESQANMQHKDIPY
jgi:Phytanoyl-CoA dioxygenase (PhyH)